MSDRQIDPAFLALPFRALSEAALGRARELGASHADFRFERVRTQHIGVRDGRLQGASDSEDLGFAVRVIHQGAWGFASGVVLTLDEAVAVADRAVEVARVAATMTTTPVELAPEPVYDDVQWVSPYLVNPLEVPLADKTAVLVDWTERLLAHAAARVRVDGHVAEGRAAGAVAVERPGGHATEPAVPGEGGEGPGVGQREHLAVDVVLADHGRRPDAAPPAARR